MPTGTSEVLGDSLFAFYQTSQSYDEMFHKDGSPKAHWQQISHNLQQLGVEALKDRQEEILWYLKENGVTYHVYSDPQGHKRTWQLNAIPLVLEEKEWEKIAQGLKQRTRLLNFIHDDLYGARTLLKNHIIPPHIVFAHRGFLRPCSGIHHPAKPSLKIYAADMARGPDGRMWIMNDRTQAPSGMGYALENRLTINSVVPELMEGLHVKKLRGFFADFKNMLRASATTNTDNPSIVVLTPGSHNETYFEHTYLASHLGYPLVQGNDLVARDGHVWLKSLQGLKKIDVILRRVDDDYCDPLELREDSYLGIAGLLDVVRKGNVSIVNPIGTGILENPGLIPFMRQIAKYFLNEDLLMPQIATWWCGQKKEREFVLANLDILIIKPIDGSNRNIIGNLLSQEQKELLTRKILDKPYLYVGQEQVSFSTVPTFTGSALEPRNSSWRAFLAANGDDYSVMPGGLVRVAPKKDDLFVSNQKGGDSKDIWIMSAQEDLQDMLPPIKEASPLSPSSLEDLPSLTAENLFWVGRYTGRALWSARYIRTLIRLMFGAHTHEQPTEQETLHQLCMGLTHLTMTYPGFLVEQNGAMIENPRQEILSVMFNEQRIGSLSNVLVNLSNANDSVRNLWPMDAWRVFDALMKSWMKIKYESIRNLRMIVPTIDQLITRIMAHMALIQEGILLEQGQLLYTIGLRIEECMLSISKIRSLMVFEQEKEVEYELMEALLNSHESLNTYRYIYRSYLKVDNVLHLLLLDANYPRSLLNKLGDLKHFLSRLPHSSDPQVSSDYQNLSGMIYERLHSVQSSDLAKAGEDGSRAQLESLLAETFEGLSQLSDLLTKTYFSHSYEQGWIQSQFQSQSSNGQQQQLAGIAQV